MTDKRPPAARPSRSAVRPVARFKRKIPRQATSSVAYELVPPAPDDPLLDFVPVPHVAARSNSITPDVQRAFIAQLAATGIVTDAARHVGKSMEALYKLRQRPGAEGFRAAWDAALDRGVSRLEDSALARALNGEEKPILHAGKVVGTERRHNDALVMFFLRNRLPHRYDRQQDVGPGHPLYEKVAAAYAAEQRRIASDPVAEARRLRMLHTQVARWYRHFMELWEGRLGLMGIDIHDPAFLARTEQLKAEGRWPEENVRQFGIRVGLFDDPEDQPAR